jgi:hypothetical protein
MSESSINTGQKKSLVHLFNKVAFRILLVDDKVGSRNENEKCRGHFCNPNNESINLDIKGCEIADCTSEECKLCTIKRLMDDGGGQDGKRELFNQDDAGQHFYWNDNNVECYYCPTIIPDFIDVDNTCFPSFEDIIIESKSDRPAKEAAKETKKHLTFHCNFAPGESNNVQIVGVHDIRTALLLLSRFKFDMLFFDYLLDKKSDDEDAREFSRQFFDFLTSKYAEKARGEKSDEKKKKYNALEKLRLAVLDNRGPVDKFWIMPITGFNQTFIQDIYSSGINLIDYRWNISNGADPITTPWQFLYHLNKFIELQLKSCVYSMEKLLRFLRYTCEDLKDLKERGGDGFGFYDFQSFMGAEYANFTRRYGNRHLIQRDADWAEGRQNDSGKDDNKSVFATYVWKHLYANLEYRDAIELNRLIQRFLHHTSVMHNDRLGRQRLEETFGQLCFFVETNKHVQSTISNSAIGLSEGFDFHEGLLSLRTIMDSLVSHSR